MGRRSKEGGVRENPVEVEGAEGNMKMLGAFSKAITSGPKTIRPSASLFGSLFV